MITTEADCGRRSVDRQAKQLFAHGKVNEAVARLRQVSQPKNLLGERTSEYVTSLTNLGRVLRDQGRVATQAFEYLKQGIRFPRKSVAAATRPGPVCGKFPWRQPCGLVKIGKDPSPQHRSLAMQPEVKLSRDEYIRQMRREIEETLGQVADAVNEAPPGHVISASEEKVRDLFAGLRQKAYETAVQMRVDAAEAAFPPSGGPADRQDQAE